MLISLMRVEMDWGLYDLPLLCVLSIVRGPMQLHCVIVHVGGLLNRLACMSMHICVAVHIRKDSFQLTRSSVV